MTALIEGIVHQLGSPGGYQVLVVALLCFNYFPVVFHQLAIVFYTEVPPHSCRLPDSWPWHKQFSIPKVVADGQSGYDECRMFVYPINPKMGTKSCVYGWEFHPDDREWTVVAEWGLVCEREYLVHLASMVYYGGVMFGGLVFGTLADKFGRKPIVLFTLYAQTAIAIGIYFVRNFILFVILRFFLGLLLQGLQCTTFCLLMEQMTTRYRTLAGMSCAMAASLATISLSLVAYSVQHWRYIQLAISLPSVITVLYFWLLPESVRWLLTVMEVDNARATANKFTHFNKVALDEQFAKDLELVSKQMSSSAAQMENYGLREILTQGPALRLTSLVLCFCWFSTATLYQGLSLMVPNMSGNKYANLAIVGVSELIGFVLMYFLLERFGRKRSLAALLILCGAVCISAVVAENLEKGDGSEANSVSTALALVEKTCGAACLACLFIYAAEIFPTVIRCFGIGVCLFCLQLGWIVAPQILKLGHHTMKSVPWIIFGAFALLAGFLVLLLPETMPKSLPDTMEDAESFLQRKKSNKNPAKGAAASPRSKNGVQNADAKKASGSSGTSEVSEDSGRILEFDDGEFDVGDDDFVDDDDDDESEDKRGGKMVRFYGLGHRDDEVEDPCHEVRTRKKERIRMVRFSFENEEFRLPRSPSLRAPRFSVIKEEPELEESAEAEMDAKDCAATVREQPKSATADAPVVQQKLSRFTVQRVPEVGVAAIANGRCDISGGVDVPVGSRFKVQRVVEDPITSNNNNNNDGNNNNQIIVVASRFKVQRVVEDALSDGANNHKVGTSRFIVQRVVEESPFNDDNNNTSDVVDASAVDLGDDGEGGKEKLPSIDAVLVPSTSSEAVVVSLADETSGEPVVGSGIDQEAVDLVESITAAS